MRKPLGTRIALALSIAVGMACQVSKSSNPLSPSVAGPIAGVVISAPNLLEPGQDWQIRMRDQPVRLMIGNAGTNGVRPISYTFEVAADAAFTNIVFKRTGVTPGANEVTTLVLPDRLPTGRAYWWRARAEDGANTGNYSKVVSFFAVTPVELGAPILVSPAGSIPTTVPEFKVNLGSVSGPATTIVYTLHVANDPGFGSLAWTHVQGATATTTTIAQNYNFLNNKTYYWRAQMKDIGDSQAVGPWSATQTFTTAYLPPAPTPPPGGGGVPGQCGPPYQTSAVAIMECHRALYPEHMSASQAIAFLRGSARDLNRALIAGGPFGLLVKTGGNNCQGYSCDIICAGQGNAQAQYDVLIDEKYPIWGAPMTVPGIRVDYCEIQP